MTEVGVYEILPEPEGNPAGSALGISFGLRQYFIVYPSSRHNTVTVQYLVFLQVRPHHHHGGGGGGGGQVDDVDQPDVAPALGGGGQGVFGTFIGNSFDIQEVLPPHCLFRQ